MAGGEPQFPTGYDVDAARALTDAQLYRLPSPWRTFLQEATSQPLWLLAALGPLALALTALSLPRRLRARWPAALALVVGMVAALLGHIALVGTALLLALLLGSLETRDLRGTYAARLYWVAILVAVVFWVAFGLSHVPPAPPDPTDLLARHTWLRAAYEFVRIPDIANLVLRPWLHSVPVLTTMLAVLCGLALVLRLLRTGPERSAQGVLLLLLVSMLAAVGASQPPRAETRYEFFLYPLMIVLAFGALAQLASRLRFSAPAAMGVALLLFMLTEDFHPRHLLIIDSDVATQRRDLPRSLAAHIVGRSDVRGVAQWLQENAEPGALTINAFPSADYYYSRFALTYIAQDSSRFRAYACRRGTWERWGNLPLVYDTTTLQRRIAAAGRAYIVAAPTQAEEFRTALASLKPREVWETPDGEVRVLVLGAAPH
jgi:hypothetical protein